MKLVDVAQVLRSKNAGPSILTLDLMFATQDVYRKACQSAALAAEQIARLYGVAPDTVRVVHFEAALAIKISMARKVIAGSPGDRDVYGAQQHGPLLEIVL